MSCLETQSAPLVYSYESYLSKKVNLDSCQNYVESAFLL